MNKFTSGQWKVVDGYYPSFKEVSGPSFKLSVVMWATDLTEEDYQKRIADLHLIAAAPDLLEALQAAVAMQSYVRGRGPDWWEQGHDAIAKAGGAV